MFPPGLCFLKKIGGVRIIQRCNSTNTQVKTAVLMLNMGGPGTLDEVEPFLTRLFSDPDIMPIPFRSFVAPMIAKLRTPKVKRQYSVIGGGSPIKKWTDIQGEGMVAILDIISPSTAPHKAYIGFNYAQPLTGEALSAIARDGAERIVAFSQYPQYSCSTTGSSLNAVVRHFTDSGSNVPSHFAWSVIDRWFDHPLLIDAFAELVKNELDHFPVEIRDTVVLLFSAHSLPMSVVGKGDPYPGEIAATVHAIIKRLSLPNPYKIVWQSKVGPVSWLGPSTDNVIKGLVKNGSPDMMLIPVAFVNDHIETLYELDIEYAGLLAKEVGVRHIRRCPALNDNPTFIEALARVVTDHLGSGDVCTPQFRVRCPMCEKVSCQHMRDFFCPKTDGPLQTRQTV